MYKGGCQSVCLLKLTTMHNIQTLQHLCVLLLPRCTKTSLALSNTFQLREFLFLFLLKLQVPLLVVIECSAEVFPLLTVFLFQITVLLLQLLMLALQEERLSKDMFPESRKSLFLGRRAFLSSDGED